MTKFRNGLAGMVLGGAFLSGLSGCVPLAAAGSLYVLNDHANTQRLAKSQEESARIQAAAARDAARITSSNNSGSNGIYRIPMTCRGYEDNNPRDGFISVDEFYGKGANTLAPGQSLFTILVSVDGAPQSSLVEIGLYDSQGRPAGGNAWSNLGPQTIPNWKFRGVEGQKEDIITAKWKVDGKPVGESVFRIVGSY